MANDKKNNHNLNLPIKIRNFYSVIEYFITSYPRCFEIYPLTDTLLEGRYLLFSKINNVNNICFDTSHLNSANDWDIICYDNKYIITKTLSSYITNKVWAWIDRGREICIDEFAAE